MKPDPEDPRPTAYLLGEMDADQAAAFELAAAADPDLQAALQDQAALHQNLAKSLAVGTERLTPAQHATILQNARKVDRSSNTISINVQRRRRKPWLVFLATAAAVALAFLILSSFPAGAPRQAAETAPASQTPQDTPNLPPADPALPDAVAETDPVSPPAAPAGIPTLRARESVTVAEAPTLQLPVYSGQSSLAAITQAVREERRLPPRESVRLEELLNSFPIRLGGVTAVARVGKSPWHPDTRESGVTSHAATLACETLSCPWKPSAKLLFISIRGNPNDDCEANLVFRPNATHVFRYRLLGYAPVEGGPAEPMPTRLAAGTAHTLVIEIDPSTATGELGSLEWTVNGEPAAGIAITRNAGAEPSDDARFAALVCTYAQWLAGEQAGIIDADLLAALAREISSETLPAERAGFLALLDQSLRL
jgi:hypothetical protein